MALIGATESAFAAAEPVCVKSEKAVLHKGPSQQSPVSWTVAQHMPFMRLAQKGEWSQVRDLDNKTHWIPSADLTTRISCAVVKSKTAPLRKGPGKEFGLADLAQVDRYTPVRKIGREGSYVQVQYRDNTNVEYWVDETELWSPVIRSRISF